jgi:malonate-semialdehyde dehydrogenase (acetylating)/methylmalonate-semialdehyde dehydrogenase
MRRQLQTRLAAVSRVVALPGTTTTTALRRLSTRTITTTTAPRSHPLAAAPSLRTAAPFLVTTTTTTPNRTLSSTPTMSSSPAFQITPAPALPSTATSFPTSHAPLEAPQDTPWFVDNQLAASAATSWIDVHDPATNKLVTRVPELTDAELAAAVESARAAFPAWRDTSVMHRQQVMFKFVALVREHWDRLAASITLEQGKTVADARGDVLRGLQVAEAACAAPELLKGEVLEVARDMETRTYREPLGVVAAICPFSEWGGGGCFFVGLHH